MPSTQEQFLKRYDELPKDLQEALIDFESARVIYEIAETEGLIERVSSIAEITGDVMMGLAPITQFRQIIQDELSIDEAKARRIAGFIRDNIFSKVVESLRAIHNIN